MKLSEIDQQLSQEAYLIATILRDIDTPITETGLSGELLHEWDIEPEEIDIASAVNELSQGKFIVRSSGEQPNGLNRLFWKKPSYIALSPVGKQLFP